MSRLTRDKIGKILGSQIIGNFSSLVSLNKENDLTDNNNKKLLNNNKNGIKIEDEFIKKDSSMLKEDISRLFNYSQNETEIKNEISEISQIDNLNMNTSRSAKILIEQDNLNGSDSNPLAKEYCITINNLPKEFVYQEVKENNFTSGINNANDNSNKNIFIDKVDNNSNTNDTLKLHRSVSNSLGVGNNIDNISFNLEHNKISFNTADILAGKGLILVMYLIDLCQKHCSLITPPVFTKDLLQVICIKPNHLRNLILRLSEKKVFKVLLHKSSKHAVRIFEFEKNIYISLIKRKSNMENSNNNSTSNINSSDQFNYDRSELKILHSFKNIDLSPLEKVGFNETHLIQIYKEYEKNPEKALSVEMLQYSIDAFAFDLKHNHIMDSFKNSPAVVLLSLLKKGMPYSSKTPDKFLTPQEEALQNYLFHKQQKIKSQEEQENKLREVEFVEWHNSLSEQQIHSIIGDRVNNLIGSKIMKEKSIKGLLLQHFDSEIWPAKKRLIIEEIQNFTTQVE